ncbi:cytidylate kinase-like family protein [Patescibacteria group bacterium]|nr:cytidylate kinase-like family protein [Patescibacteria group bacterium]
MGLLDDLITRHVRRKELLLSEPSGSRKNKTVRPFITMSRESGSGGHLIARAVAKKLGFKLYNKKLIELTAKKSKQRKSLIESLDEKDRGFVEDLVNSMLNPDYVAEETYIKHLCQVVLSVAHKGHCVILGRGSNFITSQYGGLHVRVVAPFLVRAGYTAQYEGWSIYDARERVKEFDRARKVFIKKNFGKDPGSANYYDLVINTTYYDLEQAANIVVAAFKQKFPDWKKS